MQDMDASCISLVADVDAEYVCGDKTYSLPSFTTEYACCDCFQALDGAFCKHQLLALSVHVFGRDPPSADAARKFCSLCIEYLGTCFEAMRGCSKDSIAPLMSELAKLRGVTATTISRAEVIDELQARAPVADACDLVALSSPERPARADQLVTATPSRPLAEQLVVPRVQLSPGSKLLRQGPQPMAAAYLSLLDDIIAGPISSSLRSKMVSSLEANMAQNRAMLAAHAALENMSLDDPVHRFEAPGTSQTVHRILPPPERNRRRAARPQPRLDGVLSFENTASVVSQQHRKPPASINARMERAADAAQARVDRSQPIRDAATEDTDAAHQVVDHSTASTGAAAFAGAVSVGVRSTDATQGEPQTGHNATAMVSGPQQPIWAQAFLRLQHEHAARCAEASLKRQRLHGPQLD